MGTAGNSCPICGAKYKADALFCPRDGAPLGARAPEGPDDFIGLELPGQIRIDKLIGIGSMGRVYRGFQKAMDRPVAVKILHKELSANPTLVARFHREAQIASRLSHPNVVQAIVAGQLPESGPGSGAMYFVMEYLDGISLRSALAAAGGVLPLPRALCIVLQICDAVGEAHGAGIVHRDLKPENIMLRKREGEPDLVKVLDFGIARLAGGNTPLVTQAGAVFGTARYVSPEGAIGSPVGPPADVYAIATILYQALAGRTPFDGDTAVEVLGHQINDPPPSLLSMVRAARVPEPLASAIMRNLAKRAEDRCPDARALGLLLVEAARSTGLEPESLLPRSALFEGARGGGLSQAGRRPRRVTQLARAGETTRPQAFGPSLEAKISEARISAPSATHAPMPPPVERNQNVSIEPPRVARPSRGPLAFVVGCVAGGVALAAIGAYQFQDQTPATAAVPRGVSAPPEISSDAGPHDDGAPR